MSDEVVEVEVVENGEDGENGALAKQKLMEIVKGDELTTLITTLKAEHDTAVSDFEARNKKLLKWRANMEAVASDTAKNHPYKNSSNVNVGVTQILTQNLYAMVKGTFDAREPLWTLEPANTSEDEVKRIKVIEKYVNLLAKSPFDLNMEVVMQDLLMETLIAGGAFPRITYDLSSWRIITPAGEDKEVVNHDGPAVHIEPLESVLYPRGIADISRLPWIEVQFSLTELELKQRVADGLYDGKDIDKILATKRTTPSEAEEQEQKAELFNTADTTGLYDISEVYLFYDLKKDGVPVDLLFTIHYESGVCLRQQYNSIGARTIIASKFIHRPKSLVGRGTGQLTESMHTEVTSVHNLRNDNAKLANTRLLLTKRGFGFGKKELFPGAVWEMDNPSEDVKSLQLGEVYPSSLQAEAQGWNIAQRAVGLSDVQMGFADQTLGSRDTARGQSMRVSRGDSILGSVVEGLRNTISQIGLLVWIQCVANAERVIAREREAKRLSDEDLGILEEALKMDVQSIPLKMKFLVKTTDTEKTYEQRRMAILSLTQIFSQYAQQTIPLAQVLYGPQGAQMQQQSPQMYDYMMRILTGANKLMTTTFEFFGVYDTKNYLPDAEEMDKRLDDLKSVLDIMRNTQGGGANGQAGSGSVLPSGGVGGGAGFPLA